MTPLRLLFTSSVISVLVAQAAVMAASNCMLAFTPLLATTSIGNGGLGLSLAATGSAFFWRAIVGTIRASRSVCAADRPVQVFLFPGLAARYGSVRVLQRFAAPNYLVLPLLWPVAVLLGRLDHSIASLAVFYAAMILWSWANVSLTSASHAVSRPDRAALNIAMSHSARSRRDLGRLHGVMQTSSGLVRVIAPYGASLAWALSTDRHALGGWLIYAVLLAVGLAAVVTSSRLRDVVPAYER